MSILTDSIKILTLGVFLMNLAGCLSLSQDSSGLQKENTSNLFTYAPDDTPVVAIQNFGYLTEVNGCLQFRFREQIKTPVFPEGNSNWNKETGTITVDQNVIKLDELFSYGGSGLINDSDIVSIPDAKCMLAEKVKLYSVSSSQEDIIMNLDYKYSSFALPNIESKVNSGIFTYEPNYQQNPKIKQIGTIQDLGKPNCLYLLNGSEVATPVFPKGTVWNKIAKTIVIPDSTTKINVDSNMLFETTGALPSNAINFLTVGDKECLERLAIPIY